MSDASAGDEADRPTGALPSQRCRKCDCRRCRRTQYATWTFEAFGLVVLIAYTCATYGLLRQSEASTKASMVAAEAAAASLTLNQSVERPWIVMTGRMSAPLKADMPLLLTVPINNLGKTVAFNVGMVAKLALVDELRDEGS